MRTWCHGLPLAFFLFSVVLTGSPALADSDKASPDDPAPVEVSVIRIKPQDTPVTLEFVGKTVSSRRVEIRSRVEGFLEKRVYIEGSMVKEGDVLFQMDKKPFQADLRAAKAELAQQEARLETARANLNRVRPLAEENAVSLKDLDDAVGAFRAAAAAVEAARAKVEQARLKLSYTTITSPVTGLSSYAIQQDGAYIGPGSGSLLTYVAQIDPMWIEFSISENQLLKIRQDAASGLIHIPEHGNYEVEIILADNTVFQERGMITFADASLSEKTGTFLIRAEVSNNMTDTSSFNLLRPGQFVRARLHGMTRPNAVLVPQRAVQQGGGGSFVWVIDKGNKAQVVPVTPGQWHGDKWFIDDGLSGGETVVVDGTLKLRPGVPVTTKPFEKPAG